MRRCRYSEKGNVQPHGHHRTLQIRAVKAGRLGSHPKGLGPDLLQPSKVNRHLMSCETAARPSVMLQKPSRRHARNCSAEDKATARRLSIARSVAGVLHAPAIANRSEESAGAGAQAWVASLRMAHLRRSCDPFGRVNRHRQGRTGLPGG
jgi:hypothetical protein